MPTENKIEYLKKLRSINRTVYSVLFVLVFFFRFSTLSKSTFLIIYYPIAIFTFFVLDEFLFGHSYRHIKRTNSEIPLKLIHVRTSFYSLTLAFGSIFCRLHPVLMGCILFTIIYIIGQDIFYSDIFEKSVNMIRIGITAVICLVFLFIVQFRKEVTVAWFVFFVLSVVFVTGITLLLYHMFVDTISVLDSRYTKLYFKNTDIVAENNKLVQFREKVERVNNEINYQRINLSEANDNLARINSESRSLIEVMKYFSSSFDVEKNAHVMISNVMEIKKTGAVALYIDSKTYMNEEPYIEIITDNDFTETLLKQDIYGIYKAVKDRRTIEPVVLCKNYDFDFPYLTGGNIANAVAFPAYENEAVYGVMVVTSSEYDFFEGGYSFYESSVMDFTSALISDRLYLRTEEIAKRDGLTKVYSRVYYNQLIPELQAEVKENGGKLTIAMMDIDLFKQVNDTYGHLAGDEVIKYVANIDARFAKEYNGTAVRFGGEEFLLILKDIGIDEAYEIMKKMHDEITAEKVVYEDFEIPVNASMGIACYPDTCDSTEEVVERADKAMYFSKEHGRGLIVIDGREEDALSENKSANN